MKQLLLSSVLLLTVLLAGVGTTDAQEESQIVVITTRFGDIEVALNPTKAPNTTANFLKYMEAGHYDGGQFHRTVTPDNQPNDAVQIEVIQASINSEFAEKGFGALDLERTSVTGLEHLDGTISMARSTPNSATSSFFFCIGDQPELDFEGKRNPDGQGFAAFGQVIKGMDVVKKIQLSSQGDNQRLIPPVRITKVARKTP
jgi:peptidyl-prolyl cis-trans isomerase A (cyclophilin A)